MKAKTITIWIDVPDDETSQEVNDQVKIIVRDVSRIYDVSDWDVTDG